LADRVNGQRTSEEQQRHRGCPARLETPREAHRRHGPAPDCTHNRPRSPQHADAERSDAYANRPKPARENMSPHESAPPNPPEFPPQGQQHGRPRWPGSPSGWIGKRRKKRPKFLLEFQGSEVFYPAAPHIPTWWFLGPCWCGGFGQVHFARDQRCLALVGTDHCPLGGADCSAAAWSRCVERWHGVAAHLQASAQRSRIATLRKRRNWTEAKHTDPPRRLTRLYRPIKGGIRAAWWRPGPNSREACRMPRPRSP